MNADMLPIVLIALASRSRGDNGKELAEALLLSSNSIPEGPRTVLSVKSIQDRTQAQAQQDDATAQEILKAFAGRLNNTIDEDELKQLPSLERLVNRLPPDDKLKIINPPKRSFNPNSGADGTSPPQKEKEPANLVAAKQK